MLGSQDGYLRRRVVALAIAGSAALAVRSASDGPSARTLEGLARMLGDAAGGVVEPDALVWEPSPGFLTETFVGRRVLFLAAPRPGAPRDVYRARVRLTLDGSPIHVSQVKNLTDTPHGDDVALEGDGQRVAFATLAFGRIQAVSVLETAGIRDSDRPSGPLNRLLFAISSFDKSGSFAGVGRTDIVLDVPARSARMSLSSGKLSVDFNERGRSLVYDLERRSLRASDGGEPYAARVVPEAFGAKPPLLWAVDTVRGVVGPRPIAWLENVVFGARDSVKRTTYSLFGPQSGSTLRHDATETHARVLDASALKGQQDTWPPPKIPSLWKEPKPREGEWEPVTYSFLKPMRGTLTDAGSPPPYFYRTFIRPDPQRPYSKVELVAMDTRQLELGMQAGYEDPKPTTGPPGEGRLPRDKEVYERVVATFNGAFKTTHGAYGMMVQGRVLLPPVKGGASVIVNEAREIGLGGWPQSEDIPAYITSFRQNLDPLVEDGVANPTGRQLWGWQLEGTSVMTQRTALCVTPAGHLYYAFGAEIDGKTLGNALYQAGCSYAMHLDMNPAHCGFVFSDVRNPRNGDMTLRLLSDDMKIAPDKYARWSSKDFFYVSVRDATPHDSSTVDWAADGGVQPPPAWLPGLFNGKLTLGSLEVNLLSIEKGRVEYRVRAGTREFGAKRRTGRSLEEAESTRVIAALGLGHTTDATRYGMSYAGETLSPLKSNYATLLFDDGAPPRVFLPGTAPATLADKQEAVQLPLLASDGKLLDRARERGDRRQRAAICVTPTGRVIVGSAEHDSSDGLASALLRVGCREVLELDRGSHHPAYVHRAGGATPPMDEYEASTLYVLGRPMIPHAFRWKPDGSVPSTRVTSYDVPHPEDHPPPKRKHATTAAAAVK
ncbi:MAG: hypothetical protein ACOY0T_02920 [Myxococcota bacterium]